MSIRHANHFQPSALSCVLVAGATAVTFASCGTKNVPSTAIIGSAESSAVSPSSVCSVISSSEPASSLPVSSDSSSIAVCATSSQISATNSSKKPSSKPVSRAKRQSSSANLAASKTNSYSLTAEAAAQMRKEDAIIRKQPDVQKSLSLLKKAPDEIDWQHDGKQIVLKPGDKAFSEVLSLNAARCTGWIDELKETVIINQSESDSTQSNVLIYQYTSDSSTICFELDRSFGEEGNDFYAFGPKNKGASVYRYYQPDPGPTNRLLAYLRQLG